MSLKTTERDDGGKLSKALNRFSREDPTFRVKYDDDSKEVSFYCIITFTVLLLPFSKDF